MDAKNPRQNEGASSSILLSKGSDELIDNFSRLPPSQMVDFSLQCADIVRAYSIALTSRTTFLVNTSGLYLNVTRLLNAIKLIVAFNYCCGNFSIINEYKNLYLSVPLAFELGADKESIVDKLTDEFVSTTQCAPHSPTDPRFILFERLTSKISNNIDFLEKDFNSFILKISKAGHVLRITH